MKLWGRLILLLGIGIFAESSALGSRSGDDLLELKSCLDGLKSHHVTLLGRLPAELFRADRKLYQMALGIPFLEANHAQLQARLEGTPTAVDTLMVANAVESCRLFTTQFSSRALRFQILVANVLLLIGILTLRAFFTMVPRINPRRKRTSHATPFTEISASADSNATRPKSNVG